MSGNPLICLTRDSDKGFEVIETERSPIAPLPGLILERPREGRCEKRTLLADILPDLRFDVAASQLVRGFVGGSHLVSSFVEMKLALSQEEESQCAFQGGNEGSGRCRRAEEEQAAGVPVLLARAVRLAGVSWSAHAGATTTGLDAIHAWQNRMAS